MVMVTLTRTIFIAAIARTTVVTLSGIPKLLSRVAILLFFGSVWHLLPALFALACLLLPLFDTISRLQEILDICDAAFALKVLQ